MNTLKDDMHPDYSEFSAADFALDDFFIQWVHHETPESNRFWTAYMKSNPSKRSEVETARALVMGLNFIIEPVPDSEISVEWQALRARLHAKESPQERQTTGDGDRFNLTTLLRIAAAIVVGASLLYFFVPPEIFNQDIAVIEYSTAGGQKTSFRLPDGSAVVLNSNSRIVYPEKFSDERRDIQLTGEAYFDVVSDSTRPFRVRTENITTVVLGTSFNIRAYPDDEDVGVSLVEGRVRVDVRQDSTTQQFYLRPSEMMTLKRKDNSHTRTSFNTLEILGWKEGLLFFNKTSFPDALGRIERWYGVKIKTRPGVVLDTHWRFDGKFHNQPLDDVLKAFSYPDLFKYIIKDDSVIIYEGGRPPSP